MARKLFFPACAGIALLVVVTSCAPFMRGGHPSTTPPDQITRNAVEPSFAEAIEADWALQEERRGRTTESPEAVQEAYERACLLLGDLDAMPNGPSLKRERAALAELGPEAVRAEQLTAAERTELYRRVRWIARGMALKNPLFAGRPIAFLERNRFTQQMLHEYLGYYYDYKDIAGGGVYLLKHPGTSEEVEDLVRGRLPRGNYTTLAMSYDSKTLYFGFAPRAKEGKPNYYSADRQCFHIYAMDRDGGHLRQLTDGMYDDFDPCPLPDGGLAFMSTRRGGFGRCHGDWEPLPAYTLHRMNADGSDVQTLSFHETNEWHPNVLWDGSIIYSRWDYVDRSAAHFHGLWLSNPDGANSRVLFGSYTQRINACYQAHPIPGSNKIAFIAGAHHAAVGGALVLLDPDQVALNPQTGEDSFDAIEVLTPEVCFPEAPGWPATYYHGPWPLSENYFLVGYSLDPLPGMGPHNVEDTLTGLYLFDRFGNLELLRRQEGVSCMYPIPLEPRRTPPVLASSLDSRLGDEGELVLIDVGRSHLPLPESRPVRSLRVFQLLPKSETHAGNKPRLGHANAEPARLLLGTVPVEEDGSARFRVPARKAIAFQAVDADGRAVQGMRSVIYMQPGERRSCVGCHEPVGTSPQVRTPLAMRRAPSQIEPGPDGSCPWSYPRLVQPVLDAHCVRCHDGGAGKTAPKLTGEATEVFTASYESLKPYIKWYEWGEATISPITTKPGRMPTDVSPLLRILSDEHHAQHVKLSPEDQRRLYLWLDANGAFYGSFSEQERMAQKRGEAIPVPELQ